MSQDELRKAIVGIQMDSTIDEAEKAARRQALLTGKWKPGDGEFFLRCIDFFDWSAPSPPPRLFRASFSIDRSFAFVFRFVTERCVLDLLCALE